MADTARNWTTAELLAWIEPHLQDKGVDQPRVFARHLTAEAIGCDVMDLFTDAQRPASAAERERLRTLVAQAATGIPLQQLLGRTMFAFRAFAVTPDVLAPRDATESLVQAVLTWHRGLDPDERPDPLLMLDVGTGSGCIAVTLAAEIDTAWVMAIDSCSKAAAVAQQNIQTHALEDRVVVSCSNLLEACTEPVHVIVSNPPYINDADYDALDGVVRDHEPAVALRGGLDGLDVLRPLIAAAPSHLLDGGLLALEVCTTHAAEVARLCEGVGLVEIKVLRDAWGDERIITARKAPVS